MELDLVNRDPNSINNFIQVEFDDVLAEPEGAHSAVCIWIKSYKCFTCGINFIYKLMTYLCGLCIAVGWGFCYAYSSFCVIWMYTPITRLLIITIYPIEKVLSIFLATFCVPCIEIQGMIFSRIHYTNSTGAAPMPLEYMDGDDKQRN